MSIATVYLGVSSLVPGKRLVDTSSVMPEHRFVCWQKNLMLDPYVTERRGKRAMI